MFYSPTILAKKSPMGTVWMAAHLERKIKKAQIEKINIALYAGIFCSFCEIKIGYSLLINYLTMEQES
jgi:N terminus of Rad21 / Rec8 like protein